MYNHCPVFRRLCNTVMNFCTFSVLTLSRGTSDQVCKVLHQVLTKCVALIKRCDSRTPLRTCQLACLAAYKRGLWVKTVFSGGPLRFGVLTVPSTCRWCHKYGVATTNGPDATHPPTIFQNWGGGSGGGGGVFLPGVGGGCSCRLNHGRSQILDAPAQAIPANVPGDVHNQLLCYIQSSRHSRICTPASDMPLPGSGCTLGAGGSCQA